MTTTGLNMLGRGMLCFGRAGKGGEINLCFHFGAQDRRMGLTVSGWMEEEDAAKVFNLVMLFVGLLGIMVFYRSCSAAWCVPTPEPEQPLNMDFVDEEESMHPGNENDSV